jgi:hypothetical protein
VLLDALTHGHPSWLEPRGTIEALGPAPSGGFGPARARFLTRPLRLAVVTNDSGAQARIVASALERIVRPARGTVTRCPVRTAPATGPRALSILARGDETAHTVLGLPFPPFHGRLPREARAAVLLLNRPNGGLERALRDMGASAMATALGGPSAAALVIEVTAPPGSADQAVSHVKALLSSLQRGGISKREASDLSAYLARAEAEERLDPRLRAIQLFRGSEPVRPLDPARLGHFFASLDSDGEVVVTVAPGSPP